MTYSKILVATILLILVAGCGDSDDSNSSPNNQTATDMAMADMGGTDAETEGSCDCDSDCELGAVCGAANECVIAPCSDCTADQVCHTTAENPEGSCSAGDQEVCIPSGGACAFDSDCALGTVCGAGDTCVVVDCSQCTREQICYRFTPTAMGSCSAPECTDETDCGNGESCINGLCE